MKKSTLLYYFLFIFLFISCSKEDEGRQLPYDYSQEQAVGLDELLAKTEWKTTQIKDGIVWKYFHFPQLFESKQYINIFEIDLTKSPSIDIPHVKSGFLKTSAAAVQANAMVAINGSYFNTSKGGSTVFFKYAGDIINQTVNGFDSHRENAALIVDATGKPRIIQKPSSGWSSVAEPFALAGGPLMIVNGEEQEQLNVDFNTARHPRTAIGITADQKMILLVVDGRSSQSQGLNIIQLSSLMKALGCISAANFDGGGSSTAWAKDKGTVNFPSDNGKFDHEGERAVSTVITIK
ncbi:phosphodiester glycosidase family protein [Sphingobacterium mizutaii]|uniref:phosphodiester glycosidase family protein n=1 Tax=Sphingobacterium mizutaii TaxID=1010 RepID=UPI003D97F46E